MNGSSRFCAVPPGFRFHPTDEELVDYYLRKKINCRRIDLDVIRDVDLYKIEPWDLQELCRIGSEEQSEWYFFSHKDKKYPTGTRTNRATTAGFWKATGRDKAIYTKNELIGMRKTLVFYKGRAPNGQKSDWIMHEYRLETDENAAPQASEEGWVVCRVFKKKITTVRKMNDHDSSSSLYWYDDQVSSSFTQEPLDSPNQQSSISQPPPPPDHHFPTTATHCKKEQFANDLLFLPTLPHDPNTYFLQLPLLQSPKPLLQTPPSTSSSPPPPPSSYGLDMNTLRPAPSLDHHHRQSLRSLIFGMDGGGGDHHLHVHQEQQQGGGAGVESVTDWRVLDKFVASQLSHDDHHQLQPPATAAENVDNATTAPPSTSSPTTTTTGSSQIDLWK
ncbi:unnamed protein product [Linum tenue]|uniref:NAC domain-containing protein n=1 Tax=Linum tenue TaxID=586396 RepID=A0AAV0QSP4_9ROSI|nr:unnamed protein product [Linum tenue]